VTVEAPISLSADAGATADAGSPADAGAAANSSSAADSGSAADAGAAANASSTCCVHFSLLMLLARKWADEPAGSVALGAGNWGAAAVLDIADERPMEHESRCCAETVNRQQGWVRFS
jgi:hypothetical protein